MNYKPDESTLMSYLYGELEGEELRKVEGWLDANPEERTRIADWKTTRTWMSRLEDKEVLAPPTILGDNVRPIWEERYFRMTAVIAASFLLLLVAARLSGLSASYGNGEFRIGFGRQEAVPPTEALTRETAREMINASLKENNSALQESWGRDRQALETSIQKNLNASSGKIDRLVQTASLSQEEQVRRFLGQLQADNVKMMQDYISLSSAGQKEYIEGLLSEFGKYMQEQRKEDLQFIQTRMVNVETNTDQFKKETEQLVARLITTANSQRSN